MAKDKSHKQTSKPTAPSPETHATHSRSRVTKRSTRAHLAVSSPFTSRSRSRGASAEFSRNTSRTPKRRVAISESDESLTEASEESLSDSEEAEIVSREDALEPTAMEVEAARLKRILIVKTKLHALQKKKSSRTIPLASTSSAAPAKAGLVVDYFDDPRLVSLASDYPVVTSRMLTDIQHRTLDVRDISRLTTTFTDIDAKNPPQVKNIIQLLRPFEVFCEIVCALAPSPVQQPLQRAMSLYRGRLMAMSDYMVFSSIFNYHCQFVVRAMRIGLDDPDVWRCPYEEAEWNLQRLTG